ncbi:unnamed protein product [Amoebophrya sp. A120]|nr:unnamed protein product [Amoebophrya sp. A120]|eukprot:GSA120T00019729001.1
MLQKILKRKHRLGPEQTAATASLAAASKASQTFVENKKKNYLQNWYKNATAGTDRAPGHYPFVAKGLFSCTVEDFYDLLAEAPEDEIMTALIHGDVMPGWLSAKILREKLRPLIQGARAHGNQETGRPAQHQESTASDGRPDREVDGPSTAGPSSNAGVNPRNGGRLSVQADSFISVHTAWAGLQAGDDMSRESRDQFLEQVVRNDNPSAYYPRLFVSQPDGAARYHGLDYMALRHWRTFRGQLRGHYTTSKYNSLSVQYSTGFDATRVLNTTADVVNFVILESPTIMTRIRCRPTQNWECKLQICQHISNFPVPSTEP